MNKVLTLNKKMFKRRMFRVSNGIGGLIFASVGFKLFNRKPASDSEPIENVEPAKAEGSPKRHIVLDGYTLKQVQIFIRHGARTPIHTTRNVEEVSYNNNMLLGEVPCTMFNHKVVDLNGGPRPFSTYDAHYAKDDKLMKDGCMRGLLTKLGQYQMYKIGQSIGEQYIREAKLIDDNFDESQVYVRSTNIARTIATARCVLGGIFHSQNLQNCSEPVKIYVGDSKTDELLPRTAVCRVLRQINHFAMIHAGDLPGLKEDRLLVENLLNIEADGTPGKHKINFVDVRDDIVARETHGFEIPKCLKPHRQMIYENAAKVIYYAFCAHEEAEREVAMKLSNGPMMDLILKNIEESDTSGFKMYLYSCHDSTLVGLLGTLDIYDFTWPPFGSDVRFELYENADGNKFVRVSYNGQDKIVRGCSSELSPLSEFKQSFEKYSLDNDTYEELCSSNILEVIAQEMLEKEKDEVEDTEDKERSDTPAGM
ncbi:hypothetical protein ACF0H5_024121 [Mactra antiquata]